MSKAKSIQRATYTMEETAKVLGVSLNLVRDGIAKKTIPSLRIGSRVLIPIAALNRMLLEARVAE